jgi:hypothetical protein
MGVQLGLGERDTPFRHLAVLVLPHHRSPAAASPDAVSRHVRCHAAGSTSGVTWGGRDRAQPGSTGPDQGRDAPRRCPTRTPARWRKRCRPHGPSCAAARPGSPRPPGSPPHGDPDLPVSRSCVLRSATPRRSCGDGLRERFPRHQEPVSPDAEELDVLHPSTGARQRRPGFQFGRCATLGAAHNVHRYTPPRRTDGCAPWADSATRVVHVLSHSGADRVAFRVTARPRPRLHGQRASCFPADRYP